MRRRTCRRPSGTVDRIGYEICALEALREQLRRKEVWVAGADRYRNPDEDLPPDFDQRRDEHYAALGLPRDADAFVAGVQQEMRDALARLDRGLPRNPDVRVSRKAGGWIHLAPLEPKPPPANIEALKAEVADEWPMTGLLDMLKEADLRVGFADHLRSSTAYEALDRAVLRPRLLLCLNGIGIRPLVERINPLNRSGKCRRHKHQPPGVFGLRAHPPGAAPKGRAAIPITTRWRPGRPVVPRAAR